MGGKIFTATQSLFGIAVPSTKKFSDPFPGFLKAGRTEDWTVCGDETGQMGAAS